MATLSGSGIPSVPLFFFRIATFVSKSGDWMSAMSPHSNRDRSRSSSWGISWGGTVAAVTDLFLRVVERVEGVKELGLRPFLAGQELDVVDEKDVDASIAFAKIKDAVVSDGVDHLVHESLGRDVGQFQRAQMIEHVMTDGVHQMRLSKSHTAVDEQRVIRTRRRLGDGPAG